MGFNIAGLIIDKNYQNNQTELEEILGQKLEFDKEVIFEEASENWKEASYCDIYFSEKGTLIFLSMELAGFEFYAKNQTAFSFVYSEMTMLFCVNYTKNDTLIRSVMKSEDLMEDEGEPFDFEKDDNDPEALIMGLFLRTLGEDFNNIDLEATCYRYKLVEFHENQNTTTTNSKTETLSPAEYNSKPIKPWWKFW